MERTYYVYIITNTYNTVFYIGVTNDIIRRTIEHRTGIIVGFSKRYKLHKLVFYEVTGDISYALAREKQLKNWRRKWKLDLIRTINPSLKDLIDDLFDKDAESSSA